MVFQNNLVPTERHERFYWDWKWKKITPSDCEEWKAKKNNSLRSRTARLEVFRMHYTELAKLGEQLGTMKTIHHWDESIPVTLMNVLWTWRHLLAHSLPDLPGNAIKIEDDERIPFPTEFNRRWLPVNQKLRETETSENFVMPTDLPDEHVVNKLLTRLAAIFFKVVHAAQCRPLFGFC